MSPQQTPQQMAECGIAMLKQAVEALLRENPGGLTRDDIEEKLDLPRQMPGSGFQSIFGGTLLRNMLTTIEKRGDRWYLR